MSFQSNRPALPKSQTRNFACNTSKMIRLFILSRSPAQPSPGEPRRGEPRRAQPSPGQAAQPSPAHSPAQPSPQPSSAHQPSSAEGQHSQSFVKAFFYRIQMWRFRPPERSVFGPFSACLGPPCRCVSPFGSIGFLSPAEPSPAQKLSPAQSFQPSSAEAQPSPAQPAQHRERNPARACGPCQSSAVSAKGFFLPDSGSRFRPPERSVFGTFSACLPFSRLEAWAF